VGWGVGVRGAHAGRSIERITRIDTIATVILSPNIFFILPSSMKWRDTTALPERVTALQKPR
jgi:hypothetical protein